MERASYIPVGSWFHKSNKAADKALTSLNPNLAARIELPNISFQMSQALNNFLDWDFASDFENLGWSAREVLKLQLPGYGTYCKVTKQALNQEKYCQAISKKIEEIEQLWPKEIFFCFDEPLCTDSIDLQYLSWIQTKKSQFGLHFCNKISVKLVEQCSLVENIKFLHMDCLMNQEIFKIQTDFVWVLGIFPVLDWSDWKAEYWVEKLQKLEQNFYLSSTCGLAGCSASNFSRLRKELHFLQKRLRGNAKI